jgi:hypothetical protein
MSEPAKIPYWRLWLLSQSLVCLSLFLFFTNQFGTLEYFGLAMYMGIMVTIPAGLFATGIGTIAFLVAKSIIKRRHPSFHVAVIWLLSPTLVCLLFLLIAGVIQSLPKNRLASVSRGFAPRSVRDVQVSGYSGFLSGLWIAKFKTGSAEFYEFATEAGLQPTPSNNLHWVTNRIPSHFQVNLETGSWYKLSFSDESKRERASHWAHFNPETGAAFILREYHD